MENDFYDENDVFDGDGGDVFNFIHRIGSMEIVYSQPEIKYRLIGPYIKGDVLGEGSYGKVKECIHSRTLQRCAIKIMKQKTLRKIPNGEANVKREIRVLRGLDHKNVIKLLDVMYFSDKQKIYMVMEYCVTGLQEMLDNSPKKKFPVWQAHKYFLQLMNGLLYLHAKGVVHKDIKPGNLMLATDHTLKIIDFGVAEQLPPLSGNDLVTSSQGSPVFQPPEVAEGGGDKKGEMSGFKIDVWSSGVTLYNLVSGHYPFEGENVFRLYEDIVSPRPPKMPPETDGPLRSLLSGMMLKNPQERMAVRAVMSHEWFLRKQMATSGEPEVPRIPPIINSELGGGKFLPVDAIRMQFYEGEENDCYPPTRTAPCLRADTPPSNKCLSLKSLSVCRTS